jgi:hypothetical protein
MLHYTESVTSTTIYIVQTHSIPKPFALFKYVQIPFALFAIFANPETTRALCNLRQPRKDNCSRENKYMSKPATKFRINLGKQKYRTHPGIHQNALIFE